MTLLLIIRRTREECLSRQVFLMKYRYDEGPVNVVDSKVEIDASTSVEELQDIQKRLMRQRIIALLVQLALLWDLLLGVLYYVPELSKRFEINNPWRWAILALAAVLSAIVYYFMMVLHDKRQRMKMVDRAIRERLNILKMFCG